MILNRPDWRSMLPDALSDDWLDAPHGGDEVSCFVLIDGIDCKITKRGIELYINGVWHAPVEAFTPDAICLSTFRAMKKAGVGFQSGHYVLTGPEITGASGNTNPYSLRRPVLIPADSFCLPAYSLGLVQDHTRKGAGVLCRCGLTYAVSINRDFRAGSLPQQRRAP